VLSWVESLQPDLIISHGPERLSKQFIGLARLGGINIHWGLSPTYRGMHATRWPLLQGKPEWIGVTAHQLDPGLDSGPILYQARPDLKPGDTFRQIEYRLTNLACDIVPEATREVLEGVARPVPQDLDQGRLYWLDEWSPRYDEMLSPEYIAGEIQQYHADKPARDAAAPLINSWMPS